MYACSRIRGQYPIYRTYDLVPKVYHVFDRYRVVGTQYSANIKSTDGVQEAGILSRYYDPVDEHVTEL